jgi:hypothetical protein
MTTIGFNYYESNKDGGRSRGAMRFACDGFSYSSDELLTYRTPDAHRPMVYMSRDHASVFVVEVTRWDGAQVRRVSDPAEIKRLATQFGIDELLQAAH